MTVSINYKATTRCVWTSLPASDSPDVGKVCLMQSSCDPAYMTPEGARSLAADLLRDAGKAEADAVKAAQAAGGK